DSDLVDEGDTRLVAYMQSKEYFKATISHERIEAPLDNAVQINYKIFPNERHTIRSITIRDSAFFSEDQLKQRMKIRTAAKHSWKEQALLLGGGAGAGAAIGAAAGGGKSAALSTLANSVDDFVYDLTRIFDRKTYSPELLAADIRTIQSMYRSAGFEDTQ